MENKESNVVREQKTLKRLEFDKYVQSFKKLSNSKKIFFIAIPVFLVILFVLLKKNSFSPFINISSQTGEKNTTKQLQKKEETLGLPLQPGVICAGLGKYSFQMDSASTPVVESDKALMLQSESGILLITKGNVKIEDVLKGHNIVFEKDSDTYSFELSSKLSSEIPEGTPISAMSMKKGDYTISILYNQAEKERAGKTFQTISSTIKGGCPGA